MPTLTRIAVFPIKSLDPVILPAVGMVGPGALAQDRAYGIFDAKGEWARAKRFPKLQCLRTTWNAAFSQVTLAVAGQAAVSYRLPEQCAALGDAMSAYLGEPVTVKHDPAGGFPDELGLYSGPTLVSTATLEAVRSWFPHLSLDEVRRRFRANLEVTGVPAFWEDSLLGPKGGTPKRVRVGGVTFYGCHPCARCAVPTRDSHTGVPDPKFQPHFVAQRRATLAPGVDPQHFENAYRLALCLHIEPFAPGTTLKLGDEVSVLA